MTTHITQINYGNNEFQYVPIDLEFDLYLFEAYLNDRIEDEILRTMEYCDVKSQNPLPPL
jgi:hypothetical protein